MGTFLGTFRQEKAKMTRSQALARQVLISVILHKSAEPDKRDYIESIIRKEPPRIPVFERRGSASGTATYLAANDGANRLTVAHEIGIVPTLLVIGEQHFGLPWTSVVPEQELSGFPEFYGTIGDQYEAMGIESGEEARPTLKFSKALVEAWSPADEA
ncbi:hypothetical protein L6V77_26625 [Myxococcota bacterium]|nr:hypothetical protein [Myxococcota bacterium]